MILLKLCICFRCILTSIRPGPRRNEHLPNHGPGTFQGCSHNWGDFWGVFCQNSADFKAEKGKNPWLCFVSWLCLEGIISRPLSSLESWEKMESLPGWVILPFLSCYPSNSTFFSVVHMIALGDREFLLDFDAKWLDNYFGVFLRTRFSRFLMMDLWFIFTALPFSDLYFSQRRCLISSLCPGIWHQIMI